MVEFCSSVIHEVTRVTCDVSSSDGDMITVAVAGVGMTNDSRKCVSEESLCFHTRAVIVVLADGHVVPGVLTIKDGPKKIRFRVVLRVTPVDIDASIVVLKDPVLLGHVDSPVKAFLGVDRTPVDVASLDLT